jgi:glycosyltransferase involved in cell wall biosynthesis
MRLRRLPALVDEPGTMRGVLRDCLALLVSDGRRVRSLLGRRGRTLRQRLPVRHWRLYLHLVRMRPDVLHFEWLMVASQCAPLIDLWEGPVVVSCLGSELPTGAQLSTYAAAELVPGVFARADAVHVIAEAKRDEAVAHGLDPSKAHLIRGGIDTQAFRPSATDREDDGCFSIVTVSWLRWLKGSEYGLLAIAELAREGIPVTIDMVGGDPPPEMEEEGERARILHTAHDLGLEGRVRLHGHVEPAVVCAMLQRADVFMHASLSEGLPNVVLEAMACARPVVATDVGGTREALEDGVAGFVVPPRDPGALAAALRTLWHDPELRERMGRAGRARVEAEFTIERHTEKWVELYERVVNGGG